MRAAGAQGHLPADRGALLHIGSGAAAVAAAVAFSLFIAPIGFQGADDARYLEGALRWLSEGPVAGLNHWQTRTPYIALLAQALLALGIGEAALAAVHAVAFALSVIAITRIAERVAGPPAAAPAAWIAAFTPIFLRMPSYYYPEVLEVLLGVIPVGLVLTWRDQPRRHLLVVAGLAGGLAIMVRETALSLPVALAAFILLCGPGRIAARLAAIGLLAAAHAVPLLADTLFNLVMTGDALWRVKVDTAHVLIPSTHLEGGVYKGGSPILNWTLASRWQVPGVLSVHWTVDALLRVFTTPGTALLPWLALAGTPVALARGGGLRRYALFAWGLLLLQYLLNTFVVVIPPNTRYFALPLLLLAPLAALPLLAWLRPALRGAVLILAVIVPGMTVVLLYPHPGQLPRVVAAWAGTMPPIHITPTQQRRMALAVAARPELALALPVGEAPVGGLALWDMTQRGDGWLAQRCADGAARWEEVAHWTAGDGIWRGLERSPLARLAPRFVARARQVAVDSAMLVRRTC